MSKPDFAVICWKWKPRDGYRSIFGPETVNTLRRMVARNFAHPHRFICVTDDPEGIDREVEIIPMWDTYASMNSPHGGNNPSCYRRLPMFRRDAEKWFGPRFVSIDLDVVITADIRPLWLRREDFVMYGDTNPTTPYNGSMMLLRAGARAQVWEHFDPAESPRAARAKGYFGSDQAWISLCLGPNEPKWTRRDGVYSFRNEIGPLKTDLPPGARVVICHGQFDPWSPELQRLDWVQQHYR